MCQFLCCSFMSIDSLYLFMTLKVDSINCLFADEENEAQRGQVTHFTLHNKGGT